MLKKEFLGFRQFRPSYAHTNEHMENYKIALQEVFSMLRSMIEQKNTFPNKLHHIGFVRLTKE
jgi:hypothetical protein